MNQESLGVIFKILIKSLVDGDVYIDREFTIFELNGLFYFHQTRKNDKFL